MRPSPTRVAYRYLTRRADWSPGMIVPEGYDTGKLEPHDPEYHGTGSQMPPARDENGRLLPDEDAEFSMERTAGAT